jgi:hypothetical protein
MSLLKPAQIVIAAYLETEWERWQATAADGNDFFAGTFKEWEYRCQRYIEEKTHKGYQVYLVAISVAEFLQWASRNGRPTDAEARAEYAGLNIGQMNYH